MIANGATLGNTTFCALDVVPAVGKVDEAIQIVRKGDDVRALRPAGNVILADTSGISREVARNKVTSELCQQQ